MGRRCVWPQINAKTLVLFSLQQTAEVTFKQSGNFSITDSKTGSCLTAATAAVSAGSGPN